MTYILNINENNNNISYNDKLFLKIKDNYFLHENIKNSILKKNFNIKKLNAICFNTGPSKSYFKIRSRLSTVKGICFSLNIPLIIIDDFLILINKKINFFKKKKYKNIIYIIYSYNKKKKFYKIYNFKKKKISFFKKKKKNFKNNFFFIYKKNKNLIKINKKFYYIKYNINDVICLSYKLYKKKKFLKNINSCEPIYI
ncbi:MAG: hypothetical protein NHG02_00725 [Candidatus Shikimatogenerans bostrichidophilus]|nr:MAG: hypothetical protein NHG02_00725 [Candidatus Shikimatogenerans bostrichidophilus]